MSVKKSVKIRKRKSRKTRKIKKPKNNLYKRVKRGGQDEEVGNLRENECPICLSNMDEKDKLTAPCSHSFHRNCIERWCRKPCVCPICRDPRIFNFVNQQNQAPTAQELNEIDPFLDDIKSYIRNFIDLDNYDDDDAIDNRQFVINSQIMDIQRFINDNYILNNSGARNRRQIFPNILLTFYNIIGFIVQEVDGSPKILIDSVFHELPLNYNRNSNLFYRITTNNNKIKLIPI